MTTFHVSERKPVYAPQYGVGRNQKERRGRASLIRATATMHDDDARPLEPPPQGVGITPELVETVQLLYALGCGIDEIADALNRPYERIRHIVNRWGCES